MLGIPGNLKFAKTKNGIKVSLPENTSSFNKLNYAWVFKVTGGLK
jgi:hypothetical protein